MDDRFRSFLFLAVAIAIFSSVAAPPSRAQPVAGPAAESDRTWTIEMKRLGEDGLTRDRRITGFGTFLSSLFGGDQEKMVRHGSVTLNGTTHTIYLPQASEYTTHNKGKSQSHH